jgi:hypothetical protein
VHEQPRVAEQVANLRRLPEQAEPQLAVEDVRFGRAHPRRAVAADRRDKDDAGLQQPVSPEFSQAGLLALQIDPSHESSIPGSADIENGLAPVVVPLAAWLKAA